MTNEQYRPEYSSDDAEKPYSPSVGSMDYIDAFFDPDAAEAFIRIPVMFNKVNKGEK